MQGWIKLHRKIMCSDIFQNEKLFKVFMYCLLKATHSDHETKVGRQKVKLTPGQFVYGRKKAALELDMKESSVRDYIEILKEDNVINVKSTNKYSVITVVNWDIYQSKEEETDNKSDNKTDNKPTAKGQQKDTNKNGKNGENEKKKDSYSNEFERFWEIYPRKVDKKKANKSFIVIIKKHSLETILEGTKKYSESVKGKETQYIKHASTFLHNESFIDGFEDKPNKPVEQGRRLQEFDFSNMG